MLLGVFQDHLLNTIHLTLLNPDNRSIYFVSTVFDDSREVGLESGILDELNFILS